MHKSMNACFYRTVNDECIIELYYVIIFQQWLVLQYHEEGFFSFHFSFNEISEFNLLLKLIYFYTRVYICDVT